MILDFLCFVQWAAHSLLYKILLVFNPKAIFSTHWHWKLYPSKAVNRLCKRHHCIMDYAEKIKLNKLIFLLEL